MQDLVWLSNSSSMLALAIFLGAFTTSFAGFGLAAVAGAILFYLIEPRVAVPLMMVCSIAVQITGIVYLRLSLDFRSTSPFVVGGLAGLPVAILLMHRLDADVFRNLFGAFLVLYTGWAMAGLLIRAVNAKRALAVAGGCPPALQAPRASRPSTWIARPALGFVAGIVGGMTAMPSAVVGVWADANGMSKDEFRRLVQPFILSMQVFALGMMATSSPSLWREIAPYLSISAGPLALGTICGLVCYKIADPTLFRVATLAIVFVAGCALSWA